jgi:hypothetical protein
MEIRWSLVAAEDISRIFEYIRPDNPSAAERVVRTIYDSAGSLESLRIEAEWAVWSVLANWCCRRFRS